jgi:hypothetical protein
MAERIEWIDADAVHEIDAHWMPGYFTDGFGSVNTGSAVAFAGVVIEGSIAELEDFVVRMQTAIDEMKDSLAEFEEEG